MNKLDWTLEVHRVYKKTFEQELLKIKCEFISADTLREIENALKMPEDFEKEEVEEEEYSKPTGEVLEHYIYVCTKNIRDKENSYNETNTITNTNQISST